MRKWRYGTGIRHHQMYATYLAMIHRCYNRNNRQFHNYGARGIFVDDSWLPDSKGSGKGFWQFVKDVGPKPSDETYASGRPKWTLDRRDNDGPYTPWNMVWADQSQQNLNRRSWELLYGSGFKLLPGRVQTLHPNPFQPNRYHESSYAVKYLDQGKWVYLALCNEHLGKLRGNHPECTLTGYSFPASFCMRCQPTEGRTQDGKSSSSGHFLWSITSIVRR